MKKIRFLTFCPLNLFEKSLFCFKKYLFSHVSALSFKKILLRILARRKIFNSTTGRNELLSHSQGIILNSSILHCRASASLNFLQPYCNQIQIQLTSSSSSSFFFSFLFFVPLSLISADASNHPQTIYIGQSKGKLRMRHWGQPDHPLSGYLLSILLHHCQIKKAPIEGMFREVGNLNIYGQNPCRGYMVVSHLNHLRPMLHSKSDLSSCSHCWAKRERVDNGIN